MSSRPRQRSCLVLGLLTACGPAAPATDTADASTSTTATTTTTATSTTGTTSSLPVVTSGDATTHADTGAAPGSTSTSGAHTSTGFTEESTGTIEPLDLGGGRDECDFVLQDCPRGEKCVAHDPDDFLWSTFICVPVVEDPDQPGEPCSAMAFFSGIDTCDSGSTCWHLNGDLIGHCLINCDWETGCADPDSYCRPLAETRFAPLLCMVACDPLAQDCPGDEVCNDDEYWRAPHYNCYPATGVVADALFDECAPYAYGMCAAGLTCTSYTEQLPDCQPGGCCVPYCDLSAPSCPEGLACAALPGQGDIPPKYADVGVCQAP